MLRILLVDDNEIDCFITQRLFSHINLPIEFKSITNVEEALRHLENTFITQHDFPDILLVDLYMSPVSGTEFLEALHRSLGGNHKSCIVVISSSTHPPMLRLRELGVCEFVQKPLTIDKIVTLIERCSAPRVEQAVLDEQKSNPR